MGMIDAIRSNEPKKGPRVVPFEVYEILCNSNSESARKNGILSKEIYEAVVADPSTVMTVVEGHLVPVLVDMAYGLGLGYDETRSRDYANSNEAVSVLALPIGELSEDAQKSIVDVVTQAGSRSIYFSENGNDGDTLIQGLVSQGIRAEERELVDSRAKPEFQQPSLSFYELDVLHSDREGVPRRRLDDMLQHFLEHTLPAIEDPNNDVMLRPGDSFSDKELDQIWDLYLNRFQYLGESHPMSMEDEKQDFIDLFNDPSILASLKYVDGRVVAFSYFTEEMQKLYWINQAFLKKVAQTAESSEMVIFFPGIVADSRVAGMNAFEVISRFAQELDGVKGSAKVLFENTNLSEQYVPKIVQRSISGVETLSVSTPTKIDETKYRLIEI